ncbi:MAG: VWA domain-containing protein [Chthoniobacterales bacterium]|nr:VWA domain-containing protein [Chthoniobacterales bacterium]
METAALSFERAWVLNALWLLPLVVALFWWSERRRKTAIGRFVAPKLRALLAGNASPLRRLFRSACVVAALGLLVAALAGPRLGYDTLEVPHRGRDVIIAMDVSRSMLAPDIVPTRLDRAKLFAEDLVGELGSDRLGLVAFAGSAFLQAPLTLDHGAVLAALDELDTSVIPKGGTNLEAAIGTADEAFGKAEGFSRAVVIISDGEELSPGGVTAAKEAAAQGVRIFTVGVGSSEGSEIPDGTGEFIRDPDTRKIVNSKLDETRMKEIAEATGGFYTRLDDGAAALIAAEGIGRMAEADITASSSRRPIERYQWPLGAAIGLLVLQALVGERRRRAAALLVVLVLWPASGWAAPAGIEAYEQGNYEKAGEAFERRLKMEPDSAALQLNAGTAAYRLKDYAKASQYFSRAALSDDLSVRSVAEYNFANTLFRQGEGQQDKEKKTTDWKEAIGKYDAALKTRPDYKEAKENKERVEQLLKELEKEQKQEQKQKNQEQKQDQEQNKQDQQKDQQQKQDQNQQQDQQQKQDQQPQKGEGQKEQKQEQQKDQDQSGNGSGSDQQQKDEKQKQDQQKEQEQKENKSDQQQQQGGGDKKEEKPGAQGEKKDEEQKQEQPDQQQGKNEGQQDKKQDQSSQTGESRPQSGQPGDERSPAPQQGQEKKQGELRGAGQAEPGKQDEQQAQAAALEEEEDGKMNETQARALLRALQGDEGKVDLLERQTFQDVSKDW